MQSRNPAVRKSGQNGSPDPKLDRRPRGLLSVRSALVLTLAVLAALGGAVLLYAAHRPAALIALGAVGIFAAALKFFDEMIELGESTAASAHCPGFRRGPRPLSASWIAGPFPARQARRRGRGATRQPP